MASIQANFVLPNGVTLPVGMDSKILDKDSPASKLISRLDPTQMRIVLDRFDIALRKEEIRNQHRYFCNMLRKHLHFIDSKNNPSRHVRNSMSNQVSRRSFDDCSRISGGHHDHDQRRSSQSRQRSNSVESGQITETSLPQAPSVQPLIAGFLAEDFEKFPIEQDPAPSVQPLLIAGFLVENLQKLLAFQDAAKILADYAKLSSQEQNEKFSDTLRKIHQSTIDCDQYLDFVKKTHPNSSDIDDQQKGDRLQNVILRSVITELLSAGNPFCLLQLDDTDLKRVQWNEVSFTEKQTGETDVEFFIRRISKFLDPE